MHCPSCHTELRPSERQGVEIDYCPGCRGVWLDRGELDKIIDRVAQEVPPAYAGERPYRGAARYDGDDDDQQGRKRHDDDRDDYDRKRKRRGLLSDLFDFD